MRRREFITLIGGAAAFWSQAAKAQQREPLRRVAVLVGTTRDAPGAQERVTAFLEAFEQLGWTDRRNVQIVVPMLAAIPSPHRMAFVCAAARIGRSRARAQHTDATAGEMKFYPKSGRSLCPC